MSNDEVVDLSSDEDEGFGSESDGSDDYIAVSAGWICRKCTATNDGIAAECSSCGEANHAEANGSVEAGVDVVDLTGPAPILERAGAYLRNQDAVQLDICSCTVSREDLQGHVRMLGESLPSSADSVDGHFSCLQPGCGQSLSRRDIVTGVGSAQSLLQLDRRVYKLFLPHTTEPTRSSRRRAASATACLAQQLCTAIEKLQLALTGSRSTLAGESQPASPSGEPAKRARTAASGLAAAAAGIAAVIGGRGSQADKVKPKAASVKGLAKGTGYGGSLDYTAWSIRGMDNRRPANKHVDQEKIDKAREREVEKDKEVAAALKDVKSLLDLASGKTTGNPLLSPSMVFCSVVFGGPLARMLRSLLLNDSLLDIGRRSALYLEVISLTQSLARCVDYLTLFLQQPEEDSGDGPSAQHNDTVLDALSNLNTQCMVFKGRAEDLEYTEDEVAALSLTLEINNVYEELKKATDVLKATSLDPGVVADGEAPTTEDQATLERRYIDEMSQYRLKDWPLVHLKDFYFRKDIESGAASNPKSQLRLAQEIGSLSTSLPIAWGTSVFMVQDESRMGVYRALVVGPDGTPYANGIFLFDILLPGDYPSSPPKVQFLTTGGGRVRFNPNLYENGKVCLSLLGTWSGPSWDPANSTLLQVLVSIQGMIFIDDPYFNEPGHEASAGTVDGRNRSEAYNRNIRQYTLRHALLAPIQKPPPAFKELLRKHFEFKYAAIMEQCEQWDKVEPGLCSLNTSIREALEEYRPKTGTLPGASWQSRAS